MPNIFNFKSWPFTVWLLLFLIGVAAVAFPWAFTSPQSILLNSARGAAWLRRDQPFELAAAAPSTFSVFSTDYVAVGDPSPAVLHVTALRRFVALIDGKKAFDTGPNISNWRQEYLVPLPPSALTAGSHRLKIMVANRFGPSMVRADCAQLGIRTGPGWMTSADQHTWSPAINADQPWEPAIAREFATAPASVARLFPLLLVFFAVGSGGYVVFTSMTRDRAVAFGRWVKWATLIAWIVLAANNIHRLPNYIGYDVGDHRDYVLYVAQYWRVPLPAEGREMYHPPLFYFLDALVYKLALAAGVTADWATIWLRVLPLACGAMMVELSYRAAQFVFPKNQMQRAIGAVIGGLLPMNLYMGQSVSNEPLAACLGAIVTLQCLRMFDRTNPESANCHWLRRSMILGGVLGLAVLAKVSGLMWVGIAIGVMILVEMRRQPAIQAWRVRFLAAARNVVVVLSVTSLVCGWYFYRNYAWTGVLFLTHSGFANQRWWQFPGYRTPSQLLSFGRSLIAPVYGDLTGFWDDLYSTLWSDGMMNGGQTFAYRPPWHFGLMACGLWLSLGPLVAMGIGAVRAISGGESESIQKSGLRFAMVCILVFLLAMVYLWLTWPIYSCVKSSYLLSATPCLAILAAGGFEWLTPNRMLRAIGTGLLVCWAGTAYLTFFIG